MISFGLLSIGTCQMIRSVVAVSAPLHSVWYSWCLRCRSSLCSTCYYFFNRCRIPALSCVKRRSRLYSCTFRSHSCFWRLMFRRRPFCAALLGVMPASLFIRNLRYLGQSSRLYCQRERVACLLDISGEWTWAIHQHYRNSIDWLSRKWWLSHQPIGRIAMLSFWTFLGLPCPTIWPTPALLQSPCLFE